MIQKWILIVLGAIMLAEGSFIFLKTKLAKRILKNSAFWKEKTWKIIGIVEIILAATLIIWQLT